MKKIVNGKLYDTDEATVVCSWRETGALFGVEIETTFTLFREKVAENPLEGLELLSFNAVSDWKVKKDVAKGEFFLAVQVGGSVGNGRIRPLGFDEARHIFEEHTDSSEWQLEDDYENYFGVRPQKPLFDQIKEAFKAGANARQMQYEEEAKKRSSSGEVFQ